VVLELMGGLEPARTLIRDALQAGKHVITANKLVMAVSGDELLATGASAAACACCTKRASQAACPS
jgi:homoserine dehydrogenase